MLTTNDVKAIVNERLKEYGKVLQTTSFKDLVIGNSITNGTRKKGTVVGTQSFTSGANNEASAPHSAAIGTNNIAKGNSSVALGEGTSAHSDFQLVHGKFNELDANNQYAHIIGGGTVDEPKNIYVLDWKGNAYFSGAIHTNAKPEESDSLINKDYFDSNMPIKFFPYTVIDEKAIKICINDLEQYTMYKIDNSSLNKQIFFSIRTTEGETTFLSSDASLNKYNLFVNESNEKKIKINFGSVIYEIFYADLYKNVLIKKSIDTGAFSDGLAGIFIDDAAVNTHTTWSSKKLVSEFDKKIDEIKLDEETKKIYFYSVSKIHEVDLINFATLDEVTDIKNQLEIEIQQQIDALQESIGAKIPDPIDAKPGHVLGIDSEGKPVWGNFGGGTIIGPGGETFSGVAEDVAYTTEADPSIKSVKDALDKLLYVGPSVTNLSANPAAGDYELGSFIDKVEFTWTVNKKIVSQSFNGVDLEPDVRNYSFEEKINNNKTFTLYVNDGTKTASKSISFNFKHRRYWGVSGIPAEYDSNFILGLGSKEFATSKAKGAFNVNAGVNQYIYYCFPASWGTPTFNVGGFDGGFVKEATIDFTNASGSTSQFVIWRSENANLGSQSIIVK